MTTSITQYNPNVTQNNAQYFIKTVRGETKTLHFLHPLNQSEALVLRRQGMDPESIKIYGLLRSYLGTPYGPVYPNTPENKVFHTDCVDLLWQYFHDAFGLSLLAKHRGIVFDRNDKIYHHLTIPIASISSNSSRAVQQLQIKKLRTGDIAFHGHSYPKGVGGISVAHAFIIGRPILNHSGEIIDFSIFNPRGSYSKNRSSYHGHVIEGGLKSIPIHLQGQSLLETLNNSSYWKDSRGYPNRDTIFIGRPKTNFEFRS